MCIGRLDMVNVATNKSKAPLPSPEEIEEMRSRIAKLEEAAKEYDIGTKLLIRRDLELTRANDKLKELDETKSSFISVVAHQLRTPLSGIKWTLSMLLSGDLGPLNSEQKTFVMKTYESNTRMITLVNDMLVADGVQSGRVHYGFTHIDIVDLIDNILFEISPLATKKSINITYKEEFKNLPKAYADPKTMRAVVQNLLENAIKYTIEGGRIEIDVKKEKDDDYLTVSVADNGIGIPSDQQKDVFTKFFRARNAIKKVTDGSGLGLYIAKTIVEKNSGKMWFESVEGQGTTIYFTVPLATN
jgi:signal transduction histidine kinase